MKRSQLRIGACAALTAGVVVIFAWYRHGSEWAVDDKFAPPPFPTVQKDAQPLLVSSRPLHSMRQSVKPVVAADHRGQVVVIAQSFIPPLGSRLVQWRSCDGGQSWENSRILEGSPQGEESLGDPWLTTDRRGRFYYLYFSLSAGVALHRSSDGGRIWSSPVKVAEPGDRPVLGISPDGRLLVVAASMSEKTANYPAEPLDGNDPKLEEKPRAVWRPYSGVFISRDHGQRWQQLPGPWSGTHAIPFSVVVDDDGRISGSWIIEGGGSRSVVGSTFDQGQTWTEEELVASLQPDISHPFSGERFPVLAIDGNRNLHVAYVSERGKGLFVRASDNWVDWQAAIQLSDNDVDEVRMPAIATWGPMVHVIWAQRRGKSWQTYYRGSPDHGLTWSKQILLSVPTAGCTLVGNDGFEITCDDDQSSVADDGLGNVHAVWAVKGREESECGTVWHAIIRWRGPDAMAGTQQQGKDDGGPSGQTQ
jgi:hypothetical protein